SHKLPGALQQDVKKRRTAWAAQVKSPFYIFDIGKALGGICFRNTVLERQCDPDKAKLLISGRSRRNLSDLPRMQTDRLVYTQDATRFVARDLACKEPSHCVSASLSDAAGARSAL